MMVYEPDSLAGTIEHRLRSMEEEQVNKRIWNGDTTLWKGDEKSAEIISNSLGWLDVAAKMTSAVPQILQFVQEVRAAGFTHVLVIGMGGNSLAPLVFERTFETGENGLELSIIDTTDPATIHAVERKAPPKKTLYVVSDKSGVTTETNALADYFYEKIKTITGEKAGSHFVAITDPGTPLVEKAEELRYRHIFLNFEDIGDHYSALSHVGMVPAALMGLDVGALLKRALRMQQDCRTHTLPSENPALQLGAIMGVMARQKRDKLTLVLPDSLSALGLWLEQLIAASTGKEGKGILAITGEALLDPPYYRDDRLFVCLHLNGEKQPEVTEKLRKLTAAGHPLVTIALEDKFDIAGEFFRWQMAVAVACAILGVNAFDQPNVRESKQRTSQILSKFEKEGDMPVMNPSVTEGTLTLYTYRNKFDNAAGLLDTFLNAEQGGDYLAVQAFLTEEPRIDRLLHKLRTTLQKRLKRSTTVAYGPRFLHSTGQYHKAGPNNGMFIQLTADDKAETDVPGNTYSFGVLKRAQADGDFTLMLTHSRRIIRVGLNRDVYQGLETLIELITPSKG